MENYSKYIELIIVIDNLLRHLQYYFLNIFLPRDYCTFTLTSMCTVCPVFIFALLSNHTVPSISSKLLIGPSVVNQH